MAQGPGHENAEGSSARYGLAAAATTGVVTCADPEELQLILRTLDATSFNFAKADVGVGVHTVTMQARAQAAVNFDDDASGARSPAPKPSPERAR